MQTHTTYTVSEAKKRMERYCAYQERCHKEVHKKLKELRMIPVAIDEIMHHLIAENYLNETRFAQHFTRGKFRTKKWGRNRIIRELKYREISVYNIKIALQEISEDEYISTFEKLAEKRLHQLQHETDIQKKKRKLADYLLYRGWETNFINDKIHSI